eukprot:10703874-Ditylum_brightwellii.AAC.1
MGFVLDENGENVVSCPAMIGGADSQQVTNMQTLSNSAQIYTWSTWITSIQLPSSTVWRCQCAKWPRVTTI